MAGRPENFEKTLWGGGDPVIFLLWVESLTTALHVFLDYKKNLINTKSQTHSQTSLLIISSRANISTMTFWKTNIEFLMKDSPDLLMLHITSGTPATKVLPNLLYSLRFMPFWWSIYVCIHILMDVIKPDSKILSALYSHSWRYTIEYGKLWCSTDIWRVSASQIVTDSKI